MPGASSRTTGSATRWNSFQPLFIRHGSVQPLSVTTGLYGRPFGGASGGWVAGLVCTGASGSEAACTRLTAAAPSTAAPAPARKSLLVLIVIVPSRASSVPAAGLRDRRRRHPPRGARPAAGPGNRRPEIGLGQPVVARRVHRRVDGEHL